MTPAGRPAAAAPSGPRRQNRVVPLPFMTPVESSSLAAVGFEGTVNELYVTFRNGMVYRYFQVPGSVHRALMASPSIGRTFNETVRDRFPSERLRAEESP